MVRLPRQKASRSHKLLGILAWIACLRSSQNGSMVLRSGNCDVHSRTFTFLSPKVRLSLMFWIIAPYVSRLMNANCPVVFFLPSISAAVGHPPKNIRDPLPYFTVLISLQVLLTPLQTQQLPNDFVPEVFRLVEVLLGILSVGCAISQIIKKKKKSSFNKFCQSYINC